MADSWVSILTGTAARGYVELERQYPSHKGSVTTVVYPEEFSGSSNAIDRYRQGINVRSINHLHMYPGLKPQPINDLLKVRSGRILYDWSPFDDNEAPVNLGITEKTVYSGTIVYSSSFNQNPTTLNGLLEASIGSGTIRFFAANDAAILKSDINGVYVDIEDAAAPHHKKIRFQFSSGQSTITGPAGSPPTVTIGVSGMSETPGAPNAINSGSIAARLVQAINSSGLAVNAFSGSISLTNRYTGSQNGQTDTVSVTQNDAGTLILSRSIFDGYDIAAGGGVKEGSGGSSITVSATTFVSASGFDGARTVMFLTNSSGLIGTRSLYTGDAVTGAQTYYIFNGQDFVSGAAGKDLVPAYRYLQSTQRYGSRGKNINVKYRLLKGPFSSTEGSKIYSGTWANNFEGEKPDTGEGIYLEYSNSGLTGSWEQAAYHSPSDFTSGVSFALTSSILCWSGPKYFRFIQKKFSGEKFDNWALSELFVVENVRKQDSIQPLSERSRAVLDPPGNQSGVRSAPNHFWDDRDLGMTDVYQDGELFKDTATVNPVEIVIQNPLTIDIPKMMVDASDQGLMDGVIEPFPIRSVADRSNIQLPYTARGVRGDLQITDVYRKSDVISQEYRKKSSRDRKLPSPDALYSKSTHLIIPISSSLRHPLDYLKGEHLPVSGSAINFFVPSIQCLKGREHLTQHEISRGQTIVKRSGRHMTILLHNHPDAVITGAHPHAGLPGTTPYRQIAIGPGYLGSYTDAQWAAGLTDAQIVSVARNLRDDIVDAINGVANSNVHRGVDTTSNFGIRAESLSGIVTGTIGGSPAKYLQVRLVASIPGKRGDDIRITQVSGTDPSPGNELVKGVATYNFQGGRGALQQRRRHVLNGADSYFDGVEVFGLDILDNAEKVKAGIMEVVIDSETGDTVPIEAYEHWSGFHISGTYGKSHIAPIQMQGFVGPSDASLGPFSDSSDAILRVEGIKDAAHHRSYTTNLDSAFNSVNTTLYTAITSSSPLYRNTAGAGGSGVDPSAGVADGGFPKLSPAYFSSSGTAMSNLVSHHSFVGSTTPANRSNTSVTAVTQGSWVFDPDVSPFIASEGVGSAKTSPNSEMEFPTVLTLGPHRSYAGNRLSLPEYYLRVTTFPSDTDTFTITDSEGTQLTFEIDSNYSVSGDNVRISIAGHGGSKSTVAGRIAEAVNYSTLNISALSGSFSGFPSGDSQNQDTVRLVLNSEFVGSSAVGSLPSDIEGLTGNGDRYTTAFSTGSISQRDGAFTLSFWLKGDGDRNFYLAQSYCATDDNGASNYSSRNWNIRFTGYDYTNYSYQYMYFYLFDNDSYPSDYSFLYRRFYGHNSGNGFGSQKLVSALSDKKWHHFVISYDGDIDSTLTHNENLTKKKSVGEIQINTDDPSNLHDKYFVVYDVSGNITYFKFKNDNTTVDGSLCAGQTLYINVGISGCTTAQEIARRVAETINKVTTNSGNNKSLDVHAYTHGSSQDNAPSTGAMFRPNDNIANTLDFGGDPAELSFDGSAGREGDTVTDTGYANESVSFTANGKILLVQQYAGKPRRTRMTDNIDNAYLTTTDFTGHDGVYYDVVSNYYVNIDPITIDGKPHEHFKLYIDGQEVTDDYSSSTSGALSHYSAGSSGAGSRYKSMGKNSSAKIEIGGLSSYSSWSASHPSIFLENPLAEVAFYKGLLDITSIKSIYEMSLIQSKDQLSTQPLVAALMKSNASAQDLLSRDHVSATAGYEYNNNVEVGTDSLAFGGLKK